MTRVLSGHSVTMMWCLCLLFSAFSIALSSPTGYFNGGPGRAVLYNGFHRGLMPQSMTAVFSGNSQFESIDPYELDSQEKSEQVTEKPIISIDEERKSEVKPERAPKKRPQRPQPEEEDEDDERNSGWPFASGKVPSYNTFFPVMIGGGGPRTRSSNDDGYYSPLGSTAIANSFSSGKGGVATSHATSYGDPYLSTLLRNGMFNLARKKHDNRD